MDEEDYEGAGVYFLEALRLDPRLFVARRSLGNALVLQGLYDEAVKLLEQGVQIDPQNLETHFYLAKVYMQRGFIKKAENEFEFVARSAPNDWRPMVELARIYSLNGEVDRSYIALRQAVSFGFTDSARILEDPDYETALSYAPTRELFEKQP